MLQFRLFLASFLIALTAYTGLTIAAHGWNLLPVFFGDLASITWPGQFNLDFSGFLLLSGLWLAWRHDFSAAGLALGLLGALGGMLFLSAYLLIISYRQNGDIKSIVLGAKRAGS